MIIAIDKEYILLPRLIPRVNGIPMKYDVGDIVFVESYTDGETSGKRDICLVPINVNFQNFFVKQRIDAYGEVNVRCIVLNHLGIHEVWGRDNERENRYYKWDDDPKWFYVRGDVEDDEIERFFTVGFILGKGIETIVNTATNWIPQFNSSHYQLINREKFLENLQPNRSE